MAARRLSQLQKRILWWLAADGPRTGGVVSGEPPEPGRTLKEEKGNVSHSLRTLEELGLVFVGRQQGGKAKYVMLTKQGRIVAHQLAGSDDEGGS